MAMVAWRFKGMERSGLFSRGRMKSSFFLMSSSLRLASSEMRMPVWRRISTMAQTLISSRQASRSLEYSSWVNMRGGGVVYLGWVRGEAGVGVWGAGWWRDLKKGLGGVVLRVIDLG